MDQDKIRIKILEDGTIRVQTDVVSAANHHNADEFLKEMARLAGGEETIEKRHSHGHSHSHHHNTEGVKQ